MCVCADKDACLEENAYGVFQGFASCVFPLKKRSHTNFHLFQGHFFNSKIPFFVPFTISCFIYLFICLHFIYLFLLWVDVTYAILSQDVMLLPLLERQPLFTGTRL